jgi:hypothetical protein
MGYQINALFEDGTVMTSDIIKAPTPPLNMALEIFRGTQLVQGKVVKIRSLRVVSPQGPAGNLDEVHFREVAVEIPAEQTKAISVAARFKAFLGRNAKSPASAGSA